MATASLHQTLSQQQSLAPQMRKSLEILQANTLELTQLISQALETNPVLEDVTNSVSLDEDAPDPEAADSLEYLNETDDDWRDRSIFEGNLAPWTQDDEERRQRIYDSIVAPLTLQQHLHQQLATALASPAVRKAAEALLGNLDERGFLDLPLDQLGPQLDLPAAALEEALRLIQSLDPPGVGAADIKESLLLQLARQGGTATLEYRIVRDHLEDLARKRYPQISKDTEASLDEITEAAEKISRLTLNPGGDFNPTGNPYVLPDVVIEFNEDGQLEARLTGEHLPDLRINDFYKDLIGKSGIDSKARQFLRDQIRDGRSLIRSISLRQETILAIAHQLIRHQAAFFAKGRRYLRPLTMNDIADELGMHGTTVSRAVAGKYVQTPHGLLEMRAFFASGYHTDDGGEVSNAAVRQAIQQLVANEDPAKPLSDDTLMKALADQGISLARRTVAKYRDQLNILPSHLRRKF